MKSSEVIYGLTWEAWLYVSGFLAGAGRADIIANFKKYSISNLESPPHESAGEATIKSPADSPRGKKPEVKNG